jgi:hypothetical protein
MMLSDVDLTRSDPLGDAALSTPLPAQPLTIEFAAPGGATILTVRDAPDLGIALRRLGDAMADEPDRQYLESSCIVPSGRDDVLRIAVLLTPVDITLDGLRAGRYGIERLQAFETAHAGIDAETLPAEQAEAVNLVRETLGVD